MTNLELLTADMLAKRAQTHAAMVALIGRAGVSEQMADLAADLDFYNRQLTKLGYFQSAA